MALGFKGCVLDSQLLLLAESPLRQSLKPIIAKLVGSETVAAGDGEHGGYFRLLQRPGNLVAKRLVEQAAQCGASELRELVVDKINWSDPGKAILPLGQDVGFAGQWAERYGRIANVITAIDNALEQNHVIASQKQAFSINSPLARGLGTELPIVQGPMTRVSDSAQFAASVAAGGALPMLALSLMKGGSLEQMLEETRQELQGRPWGIGLLGFAPRELLDHQIEIARKFQPDYAIIAGGRPDQAASLEASGIPSFLHVPSPNLLSLFIQDGARRFIFEGRECGGHIGPLSSFILWSSMIDCLLPELDKKPTLADELMLLFAGGIHDATSSMALQVLLAPLTKRGVKVGILMGSAYLFTKEIVSSKAVVRGFQNEAIDCKSTVSLESGPGHASRCAYTEFAKYFFEERRNQLRSGRPSDEVRTHLDDLILGRLRIASKGLTREGDSSTLVQLDEQTQHIDGMYMLGQVATLRHHVTTVADLHNDVTEVAGTRLIDSLQERVDDAVEQIQSVDIALVGMAGLFPQCATTEIYWQSIINNVDAITEIPSQRWDWRLYYDQDRHARDKIYSRWGGFLEDLPFDPTDFGMPPRSLTSVDPMQLMALEVARRTLVDAGCNGLGVDHSRTSVIIGASGGAGDVGMQYGLRAELPRFNGTLPPEISNQL
ncbi:MAG TPA: beta-ketoacyl synthase N-terminal-like domain-containing protein, partial [Halioglobus sp.]